MSHTPCSRIGQELDGVAEKLLHRRASCEVTAPRASGHQEAIGLLAPLLEMIWSMVPFVFSLASEALILASSSVSLLRDSDRDGADMVTGL